MGSRLAASFALVLVIPASAGMTKARRAAAPARVSAQGEVELPAIVAAGRLETLPAYRRLADAVRRYKEIVSQDDGAPLPSSELPVIPGQAYSGSLRLARLLTLLGDLKPAALLEPGFYSGELPAAVRRFQRRHGLAPDGVLGEMTLEQLNVPLVQRLSQLRLSLERWRWLPHRFAQPPIIVNIPAFRLYAGDDKTQRVVVGMAFQHETPVFASLLTEVVFRPPWNVPLSIQRAEIVPKVATNAAYLERNGFEVLDAQGTVVSSGAVSAKVLKRLREGRLTLRQRPGPGNSLGLIKFQMPNGHGVYLHGTPFQSGFKEARRDLSHSCIRVENPEGLAAWVLRERPEWTPERIRAAIQGDETVTVRLDKPIPVLLQYGTAAVEADGQVRFFDDIYGRDAAEGAAFEQRPWPRGDLPMPDAPDVHVDAVREKGEI